MQRAAARLQAAWRRVQLWQRRQRNFPRADRPQGRLLLCHASEPVSSTSEGSTTCAAAPAAAAADAANAADAAADDADAAHAAHAAAAETDDATALSLLSQAAGGPTDNLLARLVTGSARGGLKGERR